MLTIFYWNLRLINHSLIMALFRIPTSIFVNQQHGKFKCSEIAIKIKLEMRKLHKVQSPKNFPFHFYIKIISSTV